MGLWVAEACLLVGTNRLQELGERAGAASSMVQICPDGCLQWNCVVVGMQWVKEVEKHAAVTWAVVQ